MRITVDSRRDPVEVCLEDPDDFRSFDVSVRGGAGSPEELALVGRGEDDGGHVFVERDRLVELAGDRATDPTWLESLDQMLSYAEKHGWVDGAGRVRAHVIRD
jgi:hypothetical protein